MASSTTLMRDRLLGALADPRIPNPLPFKILLYMIATMDHANVCRSSCGEIGHTIGVSRITVNRNLAMLTKAGLIRKLPAMTRVRGYMVDPALAFNPLSHQDLKDSFHA